MDFIKRLANNLLGTRKEHAVNGLGIFSCKVLECWKTDHYLWWSEIRLPSCPETMTIMANGDARSPFQSQTTRIKQLLENWGTVLDRVDTVLSARIRGEKEIAAYANWRERFYPQSIWASDTNNKELEISFVDSDLEYSFRFTWSDGLVRSLVLDNEEEDDAEELKEYPQREYKFYLFDFLYFIGELWSRSNGRMSGFLLLFLYNMLTIALPAYFLLVRIPGIGDNREILVFYWGFQFLFPPIFSWARYQNGRKAALMSHYRHPKKIGAGLAVTFLLIPIALFLIETWLIKRLPWP